MAVYDFECVKCGERFVVTTSMREHDHLKEEPPMCPKCKARETRQLVTPFTCKTAGGY
jgi:putative FmdB family regulatory protein